MVKISRGSFTLEAACLMPVILLTLMGVLYLCFFVHNRAWLTAAAYESALSGSMEGVRDGGKIYETAVMRSGERGNTGFFGAENLSVKTSVGKKVQVTYDADTVSGFGDLSWHIKVQGEALVVQPAEWIRKVKAAVELFGEGD